MRNENRRLVKLMMGLMLLAPTLLLVANPFMAANATASKTVTVIIEETTEDNFISDVGEFRITEQTVVSDQNGKLTDLNYVRLPVKVQLTYDPTHATMPEALKIKVIESLQQKTGRDPNLPE